jgi:hypothetical protein
MRLFFVISTSWAGLLRRSADVALVPSDSTKVTVESAGSPEWDGLYFKMEANKPTEDDVPAFQKDEDHLLYRDDGVWVLGKPGVGVAYRAAGGTAGAESSEMPPTQGYVPGPKPTGGEFPGPVMDAPPPMPEPSASFPSAVEACVYCFSSHTKEKTFVQPYALLPNCLCTSTPGSEGHHMYCSKALTDPELDWLKSSDGCVCHEKVPPLGEPGCVKPGEETGVEAALDGRPEKKVLSIA